LRGIKGGWDGGYGAYGGYNSWEELWEAMQNGYVPPEGDYNPGGYGDYGGYWGNFGGYGGYDNPIPIPEVIVYGGYGGGYGGYYNGGYGGYYGGTNSIFGNSGYWNFENGQFVWIGDGGTGTVSTGYSANDAIGVMLSSMGMAADHSDIAAAILKLESRGFSIASKSFGILGVAQNVTEMYSEGKWNWTDGGQVILGAALLIPGLNGAVVVTGG